MPFCPKCRYEFRSDVEVCSDCNVDLIDELPAEIPEDYQGEEWVILHDFPGSIYAKMAVEMLAREEIPAYSQSEFPGAAALGLGGGSSYVGAGASVYVMQPDLDRALIVIEAMVDGLSNVMDDYDEYED